MPNTTVTVSGFNASSIAEVIADALLDVGVRVTIDPNHGPILPARHRRLMFETLPPPSVQIVEQGAA